MTKESLSDKRKKLFEHAIHISTTKDEELLVNTIFLFIEKQDKEFIEKVKRVVGQGWRAEDIDRLAGDKLI